MDNAAFAATPLIVFDFDGTLADTAPAIVRTARAVLADEGLPPERFDEIPQLIGPPFPQAFSIVFGYPDEQARAITDRYRAIYERLGADAWPPFPGIPELLAALKRQGRLLAVASSKNQAMVRRSVADGGLDEFFDFVEGRPLDHPRTKAETIEHVFELAGTRDAVMAGDRLYDIEAAHAAGIPAIGVLWGGTGTRRELEEAGADALAETVDDLAHLLGAPRS